MKLLAEVLDGELWNIEKQDNHIKDKQRAKDHIKPFILINRSGIMLLLKK